MRAVSFYMVVENIKLAPKKIGGLEISNSIDSDNRYLKGKIISKGHLCPTDDILKESDILMIGNKVINFSQYISTSDDLQNHTLHINKKSTGFLKKNYKKINLIFSFLLVTTVTWLCAFILRRNELRYYYNYFNIDENPNNYYLLENAPITEIADYLIVTLIVLLIFAVILFFSLKKIMKKQITFSDTLTVSFYISSFILLLFYIRLII